MNNPPARKPFFSDPIMGGDASLSPEAAFYIFVNALELELAATKNWKVGNMQCSCSGFETSTQFLEADFAFYDMRKNVRLKVSPDPTGWIKAAINTAQDHTIFYIERTYEEWEVWPTNSTGQGDAPGRISKRFSWAQFEAESWPEFSPTDGGQFITVESDSG